MIYDTNDRQILSAKFALASEDVQTFTIRIDCLADQYLATQPVENITVEARKSGDVSWIDIETTPIDLSADAGTQKDYEIQLTGEYYGSVSKRVIPIGVGRIITPETPLNLRTGTIDSSSIEVLWDAVLNFGVSGYKLRINCPSLAIVNLVIDEGFALGTVLSLTASTEAFFEIKSYNLLGDESAWSAQISATTLP